MLINTGHWHIGMTTISDADLASQARWGKTEAFGELVNRYQVSVYNVCLRLLGDPASAEDITQDAFIRAYQRLDTYQPERPFGPWIRRVAANLCINSLKSRQWGTTVLDEETGVFPSAEEENPERIVQRNETQRDIAHALQMLRPMQRVVIELSHFHGLRYNEIAEELDIPLSDVKSHLFRGRKHLSEILQNELE